MKEIIKKRNNELTQELSEIITKERNGVHYHFRDYYYLDNAINDETGIIEDKIEKHYTRSQMQRNLKHEKNAYFEAKGSISSKKIEAFRKEYGLSAHILSLILGYSKNTISNIEKEGMSNLSTGRYIKLALSDKKTFLSYVKLAHDIDPTKKENIIRDVKKAIHLENNINRDFAAYFNFETSAKTHCLFDERDKQSFTDLHPTFDISISKVKQKHFFSYGN